MNKSIQNFIKDGAAGFFVAFIVLVASYYSWNFFSGILHEKIEREFTIVSEEIVLEIEKQIEIYSNTLFGIRGLYEASDSVSREEFKNFVSSQDLLNKYSAIQAIEYIERVSKEEKQDFIQKVRGEGFNDFNIKPIENKTEYLVVNHIEPMAGNEAAFGFDLSSNEDRLRALNQSRDTNSMIITSPISLVQSGDEEKAFLAMVPIYERGAEVKALRDRRDTLRGYALGVLKYENVFENVVRNLSYTGGLSFELTDDGETFFNSENHPYEEEADDLEFRYRSSIEVGGRIWRLEAHAERGFITPFKAEKNLLLIIFLGGALFSILLFVVFYLISRSARISSELAKKMTANFTLEKHKVESINNDLSSALKDVNTSLEEKSSQQKAVLNILEDAEEQRNLVAKERDRVDAILQSIGDGVFVVNKEREIVVFNHVASYISGFSKEEAMGKKYTEILKFIYEKDGTVNDSFITAAIETGEVQEMANHTELIRKDGRRVPVADSAAPLKNKKGEVTGVVVVFRDVSSEREIDKAKTEFVSLASHQLKTPLSSVGWNTELLLTDQSEGLSTDQKETVQEIREGNKRMIDLVNALLNVSRIELGTFAIESKPTNFRGVAESVIYELRIDIDKKNIKVEQNYQNNLPEVNADPRLLRMILQNLLSNAIKYTPNDGLVTVSIKVEESNITISISDTGYGIPTKQQSRIFEKLFRADNVQSKDVEGTGLGLYIIKSIVDTSGGKISFESEENKGTTFHVTIPLSGMKKREGNKGLK